MAVLWYKSGFYFLILYKCNTTDACMTSQLRVVFICKLRRSLVWLAYFLRCYPWVFVPTDVRSTGAGVKCLYCIMYVSDISVL